LKTGSEETFVPGEERLRMDLAMPVAYVYSGITFFETQETIKELRERTALRNGQKVDV
jgi:hypothetical protein